MYYYDLLKNSQKNAYLKKYGNMKLDKKIIFLEILSV